MDFATFCADYKITTAPVGHKHNRAGWINVVCPFCTGHFGYHLGYNTMQNSNHFVCYRCHGHRAIEVISALANVSAYEARDIIEQYGGFTASRPLYKKQSWQLGKNVQFPIGTFEVNEMGKSYLEQRGFDAEKIIKHFGLMQTGPIGQYRHRILIPIYFNDYMVSYTCRTYLPQVEKRYLACPRSIELIPNKDILYNLDNARNKNTVVVVEGCTDVWRLGHGAVATFGTSVTSSQLIILGKFKRVILLQDNDMAGSTAWATLAKKLSCHCEVRRYTLTEVNDASEMSDTDAAYFMRQVGLRGYV